MRHVGDKVGCVCRREASRAQRLVAELHYKVGTSVKMVGSLPLRLAVRVTRPLVEQCQRIANVPSKVSRDDLLLVRQHILASVSADGCLVASQSVRPCVVLVVCRARSILLMVVSDHSACNSMNLTPYSPNTVANLKARPKNQGFRSRSAYLGHMTLSVQDNVRLRISDSC